MQKALHYSVYGRAKNDVYYRPVQWIQLKFLEFSVEPWLFK